MTGPGQDEEESWVDDRPVFANAGEKVTCENGHEIATMSHTIHVGDIFNRDDFVNWKQREPAAGTMSQPCEICGKRWFDNEFPQKFHFAGGWR